MRFDTGRAERLQGNSRESVVMARFFVEGEERETREVREDWLHQARANHENVLLQDGNVYQIIDMHYDDTAGPQRSARVDLVAPRFARGG